MQQRDFWIEQQTEELGLTSSSMQAIERALPIQEWLHVSDISAALGVSNHQIYGWILDGSLPAMNLSTVPGKPYYKVLRIEVLKFLKSRETV